MFIVVPVLVSHVSMRAFAKDLKKKKSAVQLRLMGKRHLFCWYSINQSVGWNVEKCGPEDCVGEKVSGLLKLSQFGPVPNHIDNRNELWPLWLASFYFFILMDITLKMDLCQPVKTRVNYSLNYKSFLLYIFQFFLFGPYVSIYV